MNISKILLVLLAFLFIHGCSDNTPSSDDHVWETQTDALEKAKQAEDMIMDAAKQQQQSIEEQSH